MDPLRNPTLTTECHNLWPHHTLLETYTHTKKRNLYTYWPYVQCLMIFLLFILQSSVVIPLSALSFSWTSIYHHMCTPSDLRDVVQCFFSPDILCNSIVIHITLTFWVVKIWITESELFWFGVICNLWRLLKFFY